MIIEEEYAAESSSPPNLVFIFSDQRAWDMVGAYGVGQAQTPHLD